MVSTKHCCWGTCRSGARYPDKLHKSLKELEAAGKKAFIPYPKPSQGVEKCQHWINACTREGFTKGNAIEIPIFVHRIGLVKRDQHQITLIHSKQTSHQGRSQKLLLQRGSPFDENHGGWYAS